MKVDYGGTSTSYPSNFLRIVSKAKESGDISEKTDVAKPKLDTPVGATIPKKTKVIEEELSVVQELYNGEWPSFTQKKMNLEPPKVIEPQVNTEIAVNEFNMFRRRLGKGGRTPRPGGQAGGFSGQMEAFELTPPPSVDEKAAESITKEVRFEEPKTSSTSSSSTGIIIVGLIVAYLFFQ